MVAAILFNLLQFITTALSCKVMVLRPMVCMTLSKLNAELGESLLWESIILNFFANLMTLLHC
jgi:hypothetical protein